ncbi:MAG: TetR/AcrR family transcriptional regulator [Proteobacteria bacterium]|nr:TetR/AcrR family transcriptional regulator [Pseudomonadota bacterium]
MATSDRIERERLAKRKRILDAARDLFATRGIEAVTLREIAQRIEYSTTAIYVQFKDKQDLLDQMVREDFAAFSAALAAVATVVDPVERLGKLGDAYVTFAMTMPRHYQLLFMTSHAASSPDDKDHDVAGVDGYHLLLRTVTECVDSGRFRPELRDPDGLAQAIWATVHGVVSLLIVMGPDDVFRWRSPAIIAELALGNMLRGMLVVEPTERDPRPTRRR